MTRGMTRAMRRAADVAGAGARPPKRQGDDPKAGARHTQPSSRARAQVRGHTGDPLASTVSPDLTPDVYVLRVKLEETGELFRVANCRNDMTVRELKEELDLMVGIPFNLQRLHFLDRGILMDDATLKFYDVIPGALISLCIWHYDGWTELVLAAVEGDPSKMSCLGISEDTFYRTANSQHFKGEQWRQWTAQRAFVALYISAHRGHVDAVQYLLGLGANCLAKSPLGRTPLHVVAAMGRTDCVQPLLEHGASIHDRDLKSDTPITIARRLKRGHLEHKMFLLYWMVKSGSRDPDLVGRKALEKSSPGMATRRSTILIS
uniref:Ankyrin repeat domain 60 n=3 Tax=Mus musculus TaxID=10090 RepID=A2AMD2_MOUSE|eukprot:NP_081579.1 ankyrin repeat domain-containing protein 60 isoform 1 [Mus musculus]